MLLVVAVCGYHVVHLDLVGTRNLKGVRWCVCEWCCVLIEHE